MLNVGQGVVKYNKASFLVHRCGINFKSVIAIICHSKQPSVSVEALPVSLAGNASHPVCQDKLG